MKEQKLGLGNVARNMNYEAEMMESMAFTASSHVVKLVRPPTTVEQVDASAGDGIEWIGCVRKLIMEYCPNGELWGLINRRRRL
jgi:hypothetical protein